MKMCYPQPLAYRIISTKLLRKSLFLLLCILFFVDSEQRASAQAIGSPGSDPSASLVKDLPLPPQVWNFMRYGGHTPNFYTGTVNASIPLYVYRDPDFELPITLEYGMNGYNPNTPQGTTGLGWTLCFGGMITREVRGAYDDFSLSKGYLETFLSEQAGSIGGDEDKFVFISGLKITYPELFQTYAYKGYYFRHLLSNASTLSSVFEENRNTRKAWNPYFDVIGINAYETESDIYSFNFMGHTGKFVLGPDQKIYVYGTNHPSGGYKIQLHYTESTEDQKESTIKGFVMISITTADGYFYKFEGIRKFNDQGYPVKNPQNALNSRVDYFESDLELQDKNLVWYLTAIQAPTGKTLTFEYEPQFSSSYQPAPTEFKTGVAIGQDRYDCNRMISQFYGPIRIDKNPPFYVDNRIKKIKTNTCEIIFSYRDKPQQKFNDSYIRTYEMLDDLGLIDAITIYNINGEIVAQNALSYQNTQGNPIPLLSTVSFLDGHQYQFEYYKSNESFPNYGVTHTDYGGYFSGYELPEGAISIYQLKNVIQKTSYEGSLYGMLQKIIYPTGGYTLFEYEQNDYSQIIVRENISACPFLTNTDKDRVGAGLRIKRITDISEQDTISCREYIYRTAENKSSGVSLYYPAYKFESATRAASPTNTTSAHLNMPNDANVYIDRPFIEYSDIVEKYPDGSYTKYKFSTYKDMPDTFNVLDSMYYDITMLEKLGSLSVWMRTPTSRAHMRGKMLQKTVYNANNEIVRNEINNYNTTIPLPFIQQAKPGMNFYYLTTHEVGEYPLENEISTEYFNHGNDSLMTCIQYEYNALHQITHIHQKQSDGTQRISYTQYVSDVAEETMDDIQKDLIKCHMLDAPVRKQQLIAFDDNSSKIISEQKYEYDRYILLMSHEIPSTSMLRGIFPEIPYVKRINSAYLSAPIEMITADIPYVTEFETKYNSFGRLAETTDRDGIKTSYIWGYQGAYIVAKIENIAIRDLVKVPQITNIFNEPLGGALSDAQETAIRNIGNVMVTTYKYDPMRGLSWIKDPSGRRTTFIYTKDGKLSQIQDDKGSMTHKYQYHTKSNN